LGAVLWLELGAVRGATQWQVGATGYVVGLVMTGLAMGLTSPGGHYATGALLAIPGAAALATASAEQHPDLLWWSVTVVLAWVAAAGSHRIGTELRWVLPMLRHPRELRSSSRRRRGLPLGRPGR
jgi:hypothetical protein